MCKVFRMYIVVVYDEPRHGCYQEQKQEKWIRSRLIQLAEWYLDD